MSAMSSAAGRSWVSVLAGPPPKEPAPASEPAPVAAAPRGATANGAERAERAERAKGAKGAKRAKGGKGGKGRGAAVPEHLDQFAAGPPSRDALRYLLRQILHLALILLKGALSDDVRFMKALDQSRSTVNGLLQRHSDLEAGPVGSAASLGADNPMVADPAVSIASAERLSGELYGQSQCERLRMASRVLFLLQFIRLREQWSEIMRTLNKQPAEATDPLAPRGAEGAESQPCPDEYVVNEMSDVELVATLRYSQLVIRQVTGAMMGLSIPTIPGLRADGDNNDYELFQSARALFAEDKDVTDRICSYMKVQGLDAAPYLTKPLPWIAQYASSLNFPKRVVAARHARSVREKRESRVSPTCVRTEKPGAVEVFHNTIPDSDVLLTIVITLTQSVAMKRAILSVLTLVHADACRVHGSVDA